MTDYAKRPKLTHVGATLWLDLSTVVAVTLSTSRTYERVVTLTTDQGQAYEIYVPGTGSSITPTKTKDALGRKWLADNLSAIMELPEEDS